MKFYLRKSISFGGIRFNFSNSGIGASVGMKGFRIGTSPRGNYIHMGRNGIYYRAALSAPKSSSSSNDTATIPSSRQQPAQYEENHLLFREIESGDISLIVDTSSRDLVDEINQKLKRISFWPFSLFFIPVPSVGIFPALIVAAIPIH